MNFERNGIYHIYNQGNNRQKIFFSRENYLFFVDKLCNHIVPFGNLLAWCLMPNHFHLMVEVERLYAVIDSRGATQSRTPTIYDPDNKPISFNHSIGIMLASYTRAINKQENRTGSLFRQKTKAICLNETSRVAHNWFTSSGATMINIEKWELQYPQQCFNYIHSNPIKVGLVTKAEDWEFSSLGGYMGKRECVFGNLKRANELGLTVQLFSESHGLT
ncbi:MAG: hypothetical protein CVT92_00015 [Bacteroidetes bacterium HGW-Bacteroidetes-1]|jgi:putative transposase|nr:MAG: hypothetical protein CVT92_00015 [Bacteroidetes bacterium HGW-Bacteroidetes-1]